MKVLLNIKAAEKKLIDLKYNLVSGGTDNHLTVIDMKSKGLDGARM
jgi:glycine hydroxymethyltransferase